MLPDQIEITSHCLLRYWVALALEAGGVRHGYPSATRELNAISGRTLTSRQWLAILEPHYLQRFSPSDLS